MRALVDYARSLHSKTTFVALFENVREGRPFARIWSNLALRESGDSLLSKYKSLSLIQQMALLENMVEFVDKYARYYARDYNSRTQSQTQTVGM